ncbi:hypothetical protein GCM10018952_59160 [Streptosporangium vulgare]
MGNADSTRAKASTTFVMGPASQMRFRAADWPEARRECAGGRRSWVTVTWNPRYGG